MHYGGIACEMDEIMQIANAHNIYVIEDAAHSLGATYKPSAHISAFSSLVVSAFLANGLK